MTVNYTLCPDSSVIKEYIYISFLVIYDLD